MKIAVLGCGGTISQVRDSAGEALHPPENLDAFIGSLQPATAVFPGIEFSYLPITTKDSTDFEPSDWAMIGAQVVKAQEQEGVDAAVLTHGTDTMSYTSAALAYGLQGLEGYRRTRLKIPVVLTGSQTPVQDPGGDGLFNFTHAVQTAIAAAEKRISDVMIVFLQHIIHGCRAIKRSEREYDAFVDAAMRRGAIHAKGAQIFPGMFAERGDAWGPMIPNLAFSGNVQVVSVQPGMKPQVGPDIDALVLQCLGEANVPQSWVQVISELAKSDVPTVLVSPFVGGFAHGVTYASGERAIEAGAFPGLDHTLPAAYVKALWLLGNRDKIAIHDGKIVPTISKSAVSRRELFQMGFATSFAGEVTV